MSERKSPLRRAAMLVIWRIQQSQMIIGIVFWTVTISLLGYPYLSPWLAVIGIPFNAVALGLVAVMVMVFSVILLIGFAYDSVFRLWREQVIVATERNPFAHEKLTAQMVLYYEHFYIPVIEEIERRNGSGPVHSKFLRGIVQHNKLNDPILRRDYEAMQQKVLGSLADGGGQSAPVANERGEPEQVSQFQPKSH